MKLKNMITLMGSAGLLASGLWQLPAMAVNSHANERAVCPVPASGARCFAHVVTDGHGNPVANSLPAGYGPAQFHGAYNVGSAAAGGTTIGIVDAYNDPNIKSDLDTYNKTFGLPAFPNCSASVTTACFQKVNQNGSAASFPKTDAGWSLEIALDVETAHQMCQNCKILLVEASSSSYNNLMAAVDTAVQLGANVVSNSYGSSEFSGETSYDTHFNHPGVAFTVSSGDNGYGAQYPAASNQVTAVGGTTLSLSGNAWAGESAWSGAGSGCSAYESKPSVQTDACAGRTVADVAADADPNTGAAVYDSVRYQGKSGWFQVGGTSLASPLVAAVYALSGHYGSASALANSLPYTSGSAANLHDVESGSNGSCGGSYLCSAGPGYDGPTGLGTPNGSSAF